MFTLMARFLVRLMAIALGLALLLLGCQPGRLQSNEVVVGSGDPTQEATLAWEALVTFFDKLAAGRYAEAVDYYGGEYDILVGWNPDVAPNDYATLWRNGCSINGLNCLATRSVAAGGITSNEEYLFSVEFSTREGEQFVLGPCCGVTETEQPPRTFFDIRVVQGEDGRFRVIDLPPYTP